MNGGINEVPGVEVKSMKLSYFIYFFQHVHQPQAGCRWGRRDARARKIKICSRSSLHHRKKVRGWHYPGKIWESERVKGREAKGGSAQRRKDVLMWGSGFLNLVNQAVSTNCRWQTETQRSSLGNYSAWIIPLILLDDRKFLKNPGYLPVKRKPALQICKLQAGLPRRKSRLNPAAA